MPIISSRECPQFIGADTTGRCNLPSTYCVNWLRLRFQTLRLGQLFQTSGDPVDRKCYPGGAPFSVHDLPSSPPLSRVASKSVCMALGWGTRRTPAKGPSKPRISSTSRLVPILGFSGSKAQTGAHHSKAGRSVCMYVRGSVPPARVKLVWMAIDPTVLCCASGQAWNRTMG